MSNKAPKPFHWLDLVLLATITVGGFWAWHWASTSFQYNWNFSIIPGYFLFVDEETGQWRANLLTLGLITTIRLAIFSSLLAGVIGLVMASLRIAPWLALRLIGRTYVELVRNMPPLIFIFIFYFFISGQITQVIGLDAWARSLEGTSLVIVETLFGPANLLDNFLAGAVCLALFEGAYVAEIIRGGIVAVPQGQTEAARSLGLGGLQTLRYVIFPQAVQRMVPPLAGQFISLIKDSSIVSLISVQELTFSGQQIAIANRKLFEVWLTVAALYFVLCFSLSVASRRLERYLSRADR